MKKAAALILTAVMLFLMSAPISAFTIVYDGKVEDYPWDPIVMVVDGHTVETKEMPPIILNGRTMVPAREFFEQLGAKVSWNQAAKQVTIDYNDEKIILTINSRTVYIGYNSAVISQSDPAPKIVNDKTMIPVRFVAEEFGFDVEWKNETRTVIISSPENETTELSKVAFSPGEEIDTVFVQLEEFVNPSIFKMQNPDRIVIDVYGTKATVKDGSIREEGCAVEAVRFSQHPDRFRIVADLKAEADYEILKLKNGMEINIIKTGEDFEDMTDVPQEDVIIDEDATISDNDGKFVIVIDPGHGGSDTGAIYPVGVQNPTVKEKDLTLDIALKVKENLEDAGIKVIMTRTGDSYPTLKERVELANNSEADLYVSVHINAMDNKDEIDGAQVYYHRDSEFGKKLAKEVYDSIVDITGLTERGVQDGSSFYVLKNTKMPAILTETGFITNENDRDYITTKKGRQAIADAISEGILEALR